MTRSLRRCLAVGAALAALMPPAARADLKLCNRMSYVVEAAIGIENKGAVATRGWFRIDPAQCRVVAQGELAAERLFLHARVLPLYGPSPPPQRGDDQLCVAASDFIIATARACRTGQTAAPFAEIKPARQDDGTLIATLAEDRGYDDEEARLAAIQRLLVIAGQDVTPIDGVDGPKTQAALARFLRERNLTADMLKAPDAFDRLIAAVQTPAAAGFAWCNDTPHRVMAALGLDDGKTVTTRGWYRVEPGKCTSPEISGTPRRLLSFAEAVDAADRPLKLSGQALAWGGTTTLCTRDTKFDLAEQGDCAARGLVAAGFAVVGADKPLHLRLPR
ncbi:MAG: DUF1036 domain-containing protein [Xanthobacteraceae bacterium]|nr:MAG: DUF1036 domain-containing protein [Xanthobacteraceae bacterium]